MLSGLSVGPLLNEINWPEWSAFQSISVRTLGWQ